MVGGGGNEGTRRKNGLTTQVHIFIWASLVAQLLKNLLVMWETWVQSLDWEDLLEKGTATHSGLENSTDCIVHGVAKSWT